VFGGSFPLPLFPLWIKPCMFNTPYGGGFCGSEKQYIKVRELFTPTLTRNHEI
jgi:hypothetical protein